MIPFGTLLCIWLYFRLPHWLLHASGISAPRIRRARRLAAASLQQAGKGRLNTLACISLYALWSLFLIAAIALKPADSLFARIMNLDFCRAIIICLPPAALFQLTAANRLLARRLRRKQAV